MYQQSSFKENLIHWFDENQREMPWRQTTNPYYIWLSEVMLQQTQVKTVIDYYHRFVERFPTVEVLSQASEDEVLKYWEGLVPKDPDQFKALKGVGPYTQAAVMSIAYNVPLATVDGNVFRVWSRLNDDYRDIKLQSTRKWYEQELLPYVTTEAGTFNQAMMELGALICTPKNPLCLFCPVQENCEAFDKGTFEKLPVKSKNVSKKVIEQSVFLIRNNQGQYLLQKRSEKLLHGMWQFPMFKSEHARREMTEKIGHDIQPVETPIFELKHQFTHLTWKIKVYAVSGTINIERLPDDMIWFDLSDRDQYTFPVPMSKIYQFING